MSMLVRLVVLLAALAPTAASQIPLRLSDPQIQALPSAPMAVLVADVTGDGHLDALVRFDAPPVLAVFANDGAGSLGAPAFKALPEPARSWASGDLNGDQRADVVVLDADSLQLRAFLGSANGSLTVGGSLDLSAHPNTRGLVVVEANEDGKPDVALNTSGGVNVALGDGLGGFDSLSPQYTPDAPVQVSPFGSIHATDVNDDGHVDLVTPGFYGWGSGFVVFAGDGAAQFSDHGQSPLSTDADARGFCIGDLDADGIDDVVHTFYDYFIFWDTCNGAVGLGDGTDLSASYPDDVVMFLDQTARELQIADLDGDGYADLLSLPSTYQATTPALHRSDGLGAFAPPQPLVSAGLATAFAVGDLDGFGADDLVLVDRDAAQLSVVLNRTPLPGITDVGGALAGSLGEPQLSASGPLQGGATLSFALSGALPSSSTALVFGFSELSLPFKGGLLVPDADLIVSGLLTSAGGELRFAGTWPMGLPAGIGLWWQFWIADPGGPFRLAASNGLVLKSGPE